MTEVVAPRISLNRIDLSQLPPPSAVEALQSPELFSAWLAEFTALDPTYTILLESDPAVKLLEVGGYREMIQRQRVNDALLALLLPKSYGTNLDALGSRFGVFRLLVDAGDPNARPVIPPTYEADNDFRIRIGLAPDAFAGAGTLNAYNYYARTSNGYIKDAQVYSHPVVNPGSILVVILTDDDSNMSQAVKDCYAMLHRDEVALMSDVVSVRSAIQVAFNIDATLYIGKGPDPSLVRSSALLSLNAYLASRRKIGKRIPTSGIAGSLNLPTVDYVDLAVPTDDIVPDELSFGEALTISLSVSVES